MSKTGYGLTSVGGGSQDQRERKDKGWRSRQGGSEARQPGRRDAAEPHDREPFGSPPPGTNTQGDLAGIGRDAAAVGESAGVPESATRVRERDARGAGTDQPPRMGGPLGPDPQRPHLPEGAQDGQSRGSGQGGFDRGVDASRVGAVHQGAREEGEP